jgi:hypothetical protein
LEATYGCCERFEVRFDEVKVLFVPGLGVQQKENFDMYISERESSSGLSLLSLCFGFI